MWSPWHRTAHGGQDAPPSGQVGMHTIGPVETSEQLGHPSSVLLASRLRVDYGFHRCLTSVNVRAVVVDDGCGFAVNDQPVPQVQHAGPLVEPRASTTNVAQRVNA